MLLATVGLLLDRSQPVAQAALFGSILGASLAGAVLALGIGLPRTRRRLALAVASCLAWRISYFPIIDRKSVV